MERKVNIKAKDGHIIYGVLNSKRKSNKLVIFIHGLGGNPHESIFSNGMKYFTDKGLSTYRFAFYSWKRGANTLSKTTVASQAEYLNSVIKHFKKSFKKIYLVGHSLGGPTIMAADAKGISAIVFWDSSYDLRALKEEARYNKKIDAYIANWGIEILIGKKMYQEFCKAPQPPQQVMGKIHAPVKFISAGKGPLTNGHKLLFKSTNEPKRHVIIEDAGHNFFEEGTEQKLFRETYSWINRF